MAGNRNETVRKPGMHIKELPEYMGGRRVRLSILIFSLVFTFFVASFDINLYFYTSTFIVKDLGASPIFIGISVSSFTLGVIIFATVGGIAFNRISIRTILLVAIFTATVGSLLTGYSRNIGELLVFRFLVGMGTGMIQGTAMGVLGTAYPQKRGFLLSLTGIAFSAGLLAGPYSEAFISPLYLQSYLVSGLIGAISMVLILMILPNVYNNHVPERKIRRRELFNRNTAMVFSGIFAYGIGYFGFIGYFSHFLINYLNTPQYISALTSSALGIGGLIFTLPLGYGSDRTGRKNMLLILYAVLALASFIIFGVSLTWFLMIAVSFIFGAAYNGLIIVIAAAAQDFAPREYIGTASGLVFTFYYSGGIIGGTFFGLLLTVEPFRLTGILAVTTFMTVGFVTTLFVSHNMRAKETRAAHENA